VGPPHWSLHHVPGGTPEGDLQRPLLSKRVILLFIIIITIANSLEKVFSAHIHCRLQTPRPKIIELSFRKGLSFSRALVSTVLPVCLNCTSCVYPTSSLLPVGMQLLEVVITPARCGTCAPGSASTQSPPTRTFCPLFDFNVSISVVL